MIRKWCVFVALVVAVVALAVTIGVPAEAQNLASRFSHGPTIPLYAIRFDNAGQAHSSLLGAGAGYSFNYNLAASDAGDVRWVTIGFPVFARFTSNEATTLAAGVTVGAFNNLVGLGIAADLIDTEGESSGLLAGSFSRQNLAILVNIGFNLGGGTPAVSEARGKLSAAAEDAAPPPCYLRLW